MWELRYSSTILHVSTRCRWVVHFVPCSWDMTLQHRLDRRLVGPMPYVAYWKISCPCQESTSGHPARCLITTLTELFWLLIWYVMPQMSINNLKNAVFWYVTRCGATQRNIPEDGIPHIHLRENLTSYTIHNLFGLLYWKEVLSSKCQLSKCQELKHQLHQPYLCYLWVING
jgi:hypothetical protein